MTCALLERDLIPREYYEKNNLAETMDCILTSCCFSGRTGVKSDMGSWRRVCITANFVRILC